MATRAGRATYSGDTETVPHPGRRQARGHYPGREAARGLGICLAAPVGPGIHGGHDDDVCADDC